MHRHYYIKFLGVIYLCIIYFGYEISKWSPIFKYQFFICIIYCCFCSYLVWNCYSSFSKYVCILIITLTWSYHGRFKSNVTIVISSFWFIIFSTQFLVLNLDGYFVVSSASFIIFWYSIIILYYYYVSLPLILEHQ